MALLIPATPGDCTLSERHVFRRMEQELDAGWIVLHSMNLLQHPTKIAGEADFVVLSTKGIFVIEVKGSRSISCRDGVWRFGTPGADGYYEKTESPFVQANDAMFALMNIVNRVAEFRGLLIGSGVIMPNCIFTAEGPDIEQAVLWDARHFMKDLGFYIGALNRHWDQVYRERKDRTRRAPTPAELTALRRLLRPDVESTPALSTIFNGLEERLLLLTQQQVRALRGMENNPRTLISGRAGTGKTVIAIDRAERLARSNTRVLYICFNQLLARHVADGLSRKPVAASVQVRHLHGLYHDTIAKAGLTGRLQTSSDNEAELFGKVFPAVFIEAACTIEPEPADVLIVDEAQDLLTPENIIALDLLVKGGLQKGRWSMFLDPLQNIYGAEADAARSILNDAGYAFYELFENCRNTREVATQCSIISGLEATLEGAIAGVECACIYYADSQDLLRQLETEVRDLIAGGVAPKDIIILSTRRRENSAIAGCNTIASLPVRNLADHPESGRFLHFCTMHAFKGLERKVVLAIDLEYLGEDRVALLHYAGLSRAVSMLRPFILAADRDVYNLQAKKFGQRLGAQR